MIMSPFFKSKLLQIILCELLLKVVIENKDTASAKKKENRPPCRLKLNILYMSATNVYNKGIKITYPN